jgi:transcriptional regulator with XRE-family HTH domain
MPMVRQSRYRLAEGCKRHGLTQAQLAKAMGVTPRRVSQIERCEVATIDAIAATSRRSANGSTWFPASATAPSSLASAITPLPSPPPKRLDQLRTPAQIHSSSAALIALRTRQRP